MGRLDRKVALITGGASGLGKVTAQRLASDGARVVITDLQTDLGNAVASENGFIFLQHDVCDEAQWARVIQHVEERCGHLHILVNNAAIVGRHDADNPENTRLADWKKIFAVNVEGVFLGCRAAIPAMRRTGSGSIINLSSVASLLATPKFTAYGASKAAVRHLTRSVAQHCAEERLNVRCNSVHPGDIRTPMLEKHLGEVAHGRGVPAEQVFAEVKAGIPLGDFTMPADIAAAISFLASDESRQITGLELIVDGGVINCNTFRPENRSTKSER